MLNITVFFQEGAWTDSLACCALMERENLKTTDELQGHLFRKVQKYLRGHGKIMARWEEILRGDKVEFNNRCTFEINHDRNEF